MGSALDSMLKAYGRLPIPSREEQVLLGRAIRAWLDWKPSVDDDAQGVTEPPLRIRRAGQRAREQLVSRNMLLVAREASRFSVSSITALDLQDLIQEGAIGLCRAADLFDPARGCAFSSFAVWWIRQSMTQLVHSSGPIRIPTRRAQAMHQLRRWVEGFEAREGRLPRDAEVMEALGHSSGDLAILREAAAVYHVRSLDVVIGDQDGESWLNTVATPNEQEQKAGDGQFGLVMQILEPWPVLQEIMERRLAGQSYREIGREMGIRERAVIRRGEEALAMAQWLLENSGRGDGALANPVPVATGPDFHGNGQLSVDGKTGSRPEIFWQPPLDLNTPSTDGPI